MGAGAGAADGASGVTACADESLGSAGGVGTFVGTAFAGVLGEGTTLGVLVCPANERAATAVNTPESATVAAAAAPVSRRRRRKPAPRRATRVRISGSVMPPVQRAEMSRE
jgi:hypothetical protein